jgi:hypothetical protein
MRSCHQWLLIGAGFLVLALAGCGSSSYSSSYGPGTVTSGTSGSSGGVTIGSASSGGGGLTGKLDTVVATPSVAGPLSVAVGTSQTISIAFTSSDGLAITGFAISGTTYPATWSAPNNFSCSSVTTGSGCVLNLTYTPVAGDTGTLTVNYVFVNNAKIPESPGGSVSIPYSASMANDVIATVTPSGQVVAGSGQGSQSVSINFTTDDGYAATGLALTSALSSLPTGWSSTVTSFSCAIVSDGSGCQLPLSFAPTSAVSGTLTLGYTYTDSSGAARTGAVNVPYATAGSANVSASVAPSGQVNAIEQTGGQNVTVTFTTDDGKTASGLFLTAASTLPAGWSGKLDAFTCASVSTGNGCQLQLKYAPTTLTAGTLTIGYGYTNDAGTAETGTLDVAYAATTDDNVTGMASPSGQITAVVGSSTAANVSVTFTTDDERLATALNITSDLTMLPAGWSAAANPFTCSGLSTGTGCQLNLSYAPPAYDASGTLMLNYSYQNNAGLTKTGTVNIPYRALTNDTIVGTPSSAALAVLTGSSNPVTVVFTTNDMNPASALTVTSDLSALPAGWSSTTNTFSCAAISTGTGCELSLVYAPTAASVPASVLALNYTYTNDALIAKTGTVNIAYLATVPQYLYVANASGTTVSSCEINLDGTLQPCVTASGFFAPQGIAIAGGEVYVANSGNNSLSECALGTGGALGTCTTTGSAPISPAVVVVNAADTFAYINQSAGLSVCPIAGGAVGVCGAASATVNPLVGLALSADGTHAYSVNTGTPNVIDVCTVTNTGVFTTCAATGSSASQPTAVLGIANGYVYAANSAGALSVCPINGDYTLGTCTQTASASTANALAFNGSTAYLSNGSGTLSICPVNVDGSFGTCTPSSDPTFDGTAGLAIH